MNRKTKKALLAWIVENIERRKDADAFSISLGVEGDGGTWVEWPNDPERRKEGRMRCTTYDFARFNL
jgi:hypothetical protein